MSLLPLQQALLRDGQWGPGVMERLLQDALMLLLCTQQSPGGAMSNGMTS